MFRVVGMRLGITFHTPYGLAKNGLITDEQRAYLAGTGYELERCAGIPPQVPSEEEREAIAQVEKQRKNLQKDIDRSVADLLAPLSKKFYRHTL